MFSLYPQAIWHQRYQTFSVTLKNNKLERLSLKNNSCQIFAIGHCYVLHNGRPGLLVSIRLDLKNVPGKNCLAYFDAASSRKKKVLKHTL
jgi:hypothetical protein